MPRAVINGLEMFYEAHGQGPAVVFMHGLGSNHLTWWQQVPALSERFRCITMDLRGFGLSPDAPDGPGAAAFVEDLRALLDHLGVDRLLLVGHSMGGRVCLGLTLASRERVLGLVLAGSAGGFMDDEMARLRLEAEKVLHAPAPPPRSYSRAFVAAHPDRAFLYEQIRSLNPSVRPYQSQSGPTAAELQALTVPILLMVGAEDLITPPGLIRRFQQYLPAARLVEISGTGHALHFEKPDEFNEWILKFLSDCVG